MLRQYELRDEDYVLIEDLLPKNGKRGGQWKDHRTMLDGIFWILYTGGHWRELLEIYGKRSSVNDRLNLATRRYTRPHLGAAAPDAGRDWQARPRPLVCRCHARACQQSRRRGAGGKVAGDPEDHALGRSRGGFGTKLHLITEGPGIPLAAALTARKAHESQSADVVLRLVRLPRPSRRGGRPRASKR